MAVHKPGSIWPLRAPSYGAEVSTFDEKTLRVVLVDTSGVNATVTYISREDARLLAKRLNACLDATTTKKASA